MGRCLIYDDERWHIFITELRAYVEEHHHFPVRHTTLNYKTRYVRKEINAGTLKDWKQKTFTEIADMRTMDEHTGGRKKASHEDENENLFTNQNA